MDRSQHPSKLARKLVTWTVRGLLTLALLELVSCGLYSLGTGRVFSYRRVLGRRAEVAGGAGDTAGGPAQTKRRRGEIGRHSPFNPDQVLHPFLGYVMDPGRANRRYLRVTPQGFYEKAGQSSSGPAADEESFTVGVFGGSVAMVLALSGHTAFSEELEASPALAGRRLRLETYALGGYKQPQQLMALTLLLSLGEELDAVVNLDGFNDMVLTRLNNARFGVFPFYPRVWRRRVVAALDPRRQRLMGRTGYLREQRQELARAFDAAGPLRYSVSWNLLWLALDRRSAARIIAADAELAGFDAEERLFLTHGPEFSYPDDEAELQDFAAFWARSSLQMHRLCLANGIRYFHFLQPNQYVPGSKPLSAQERRTAVLSESPYTDLVQRGYPLLAERGAWLEEQGVAFYDLRMLFSGVEETLYGDGCCHVNNAGNRIMARAIARAVRAELEGGGR